MRIGRVLWILDFYLQTPFCFLSNIFVEVEGNCNKVHLYDSTLSNESPCYRYVTMQLVFTMVLQLYLLISPPRHPVADEAEAITATVAPTFVAVALVTTPARSSSSPSRDGHQPPPAAIVVRIVPVSHPHIVKPWHPFEVILHQSSCTTLPGVRMEEDPIPPCHSLFSI